MRSARGPRFNGVALEAIRVRRGVSQTELSQLTQTRGHRVSACHISRLETGSRKWPSLKITRALADALGVEVNTLITVDQIGGQS